MVGIFGGGGGAKGMLALKLLAPLPPALLFLRLFSSTNFAENLKVSPSQNSILPNFIEILVTTQLQNYGDFLIDGL